MTLSVTQLATFKTAIQADPNIAAALAAGDLGSIAAYYNGASATQVWRPSIPVAEMTSQIVWSAFASLTVAQQNTYFAMTQGGTVDATSANVRAGFGAIFSGQTLTNLTAMAERLATKFENLFVTANVTTVFGFIVTPADVNAALAGSY